jgi:hypothetical protein
LRQLDQKGVVELVIALSHLTGLFAEIVMMNRKINLTCDSVLTQGRSR